MTLTVPEFDDDFWFVESLIKRLPLPEKAPTKEKTFKPYDHKGKLKGKPKASANDKASKTKLTTKERRERKRKKKQERFKHKKTDKGKNAPKEVSEARRELSEKLNSKISGLQKKREPMDEDRADVKRRRKVVSGDERREKKKRKREEAREDDRKRVKLERKAEKAAAKAKAKKAAAKEAEKLGVDADAKKAKKKRSREDETNLPVENLNEVEFGLKKRKPKKRKLSEKQLLSALESKEKKREALPRMEVLKMQKEEGFATALARASGEKVRDDKKLLKKSIKRKEKQKEKSRKEWKQREKEAKRSKFDGQAKRIKNLNERIAKKKAKKFAHIVPVDV